VQKAVDKVSQFIPFQKLMKRSVPFAG